MSSLQEKWEAGAPEREARRGGRGRKAVGLLWLLLAIVIVVGLVALAVFVVWGVVASGAWKPLAGFVIVASLIAAVSIGIRKG